MSTIGTFHKRPPAHRIQLTQGRTVFATTLAAVANALAWLDDKAERYRSRCALEEMTDAQLKDIGVSRADAFREAHRPFWD